MNVAIIGTGNVAYHMVRALGRQKAIDISCICGTSIAKAKAVRTKSTTVCVDSLSHLVSTDIVLICVPDSAIASVSEQLLPNKEIANSILAHTSGSIPSLVLADHQSYGVFYPLQTFTKGQRMGYRSIPMCITGSSSTVVNTLSHMAAEVSTDVRHLTDIQRASVHLSAVVVNNLTNHLIHLAASRLKQQGVDSDILYPLIKETISKLAKIGPMDAQTGPARRADHGTIDQHLVALQDSPQLRDIYKQITTSILQTYKTQS